MFESLFHRAKPEASAGSFAASSKEQQQQDKEKQQQQFQHSSVQQPSAGPSSDHPSSQPPAAGQQQDPRQQQNGPARYQQPQPVSEDEEEGEDEDEQGEEEHGEFAAAHHQPPARPALLQVRAAADYETAAATQQQPLAQRGASVSLLPELSTGSVRSSAAPSPQQQKQQQQKQQPQPPKPWQKQPSKQQLPNRAPAAATAAPSQQSLPADRNKLQQSFVQQNVQQQQQSTADAGREEHLQKQLMLEAKAREELEDMLLRYERQLKAEINARKAAEAAAAEALASAGHAVGGQQQLTHDWQHQQEQLQQDRAALESMRADFEGQLHTARSELAKAQAAMSSSEAQIRAEATSACERLAADYESRLATVSAELDRTRQELAVRTHTLAAELNRWRRHAENAASAVVAAKDEVLLRRRELDSTKDKMDTLIDKLYAGKEANNSLSGAIAAAASGYQQGPGGGQYGYVALANSYDVQSSQEQHSAQRAAGTARSSRAPLTATKSNRQQGPTWVPGGVGQQHGKPSHGHGAEPQQQHGIVGGPMGFYMPPQTLMAGQLMGHPSMLQPWQAWGAAGSMTGGPRSPMVAPLAGSWQQQQQVGMGMQQLPLPHMRQQQQQQHWSGVVLPGIANKQPQQQQQAGGSGGYAAAPHSNNTNRAGGAAGSSVPKGKGGSYAQQLKGTTGAGATGGGHTRLPRHAASTHCHAQQGSYASSAGPTNAKGGGFGGAVIKKGGGGSPAAPDRFKEASKNVAMIAAIASRW